ncbi:MAG: hotdog fold thioesterase [Cytophagales bacterium]|nr:hotdog fold thioesterase [Cytophagales bacterium]
MMATDTFSQWLGIEVLEVREGFAKIKMMVRPEMINGVGVTHGGISFSLADSAFAFASNSHGQKTVSIETSINHIKPIFDGDELIAVAEKESTSRSLGQYIARVTRGDELVGLFKGVAFRKDEEWELSDSE